MSIATSDFCISSILLKPNDKNVHVTICSKDLPYEKWLKRIQKAIGEDLFYNCVSNYTVKVCSDEDPFDYTTFLRSIKNIIEDFAPTHPRNVRLELSLTSGLETHIFLLDNEALSKPKDINTTVSFFTHHTQNNTYVESLRWTNFIAELLGANAHSSTITDFRVESADFFDKMMFAEPKVIFELLRNKYALKDVRISINNQTWIIYTLTD